MNTSIWRPLLCCIALSGGVLSAGDGNGSTALEDGFAHPPDSALPRTWWHWVSGNVSKEGITADLEAMKQIGLGGFQNFTVDQSAVKGPIKFMSPDWQDLVKFSMDEAHRLNLEMSMEGCDGWSESGGPWVTPAESMQKVVWSNKFVQEGDKVDLQTLGQPATVLDFYSDIAIFAVPSHGAAPEPTQVTTSDSKAALNSLPNTGQSPVILPATPGSPFWIQYDFGSAHAFDNVSQDMEPKTLKWELQSSDDGNTFKKVADLKSRQNAFFSQTTARYFRTLITSVPEGVTCVTVNHFTVKPHFWDHIEAHTGMAVNIGVKDFINDPLLEAQAVDPKSIVNLTGQKEWTVPAGTWRIIRMGHTSTGVGTHPSTEAGLEVNKLSADAVEHHIDSMFGPLVKTSPDRVGTTFKYILLDSWEAGCENWTDDMAAEFKARRGYDLTPWLPALTGEVIGSTELTQRFFWDYRRTLADLVAEKHYGTFQSWAHKHNMGLTSEATGIGMPTVADQLLCKKYCDIPMGEFWVSQSRDENIDDPKEAASAAHIYGQNIAATESFTSIPKTAAWANDPASLKQLGDEEFCNGVNRFVFHRYAHQPWMDRLPGMSMGPWGINFERTNTWWKPGSAWISYLARCQYLLQQGQFQADLLYFYGEDAPMCVRHAALTPPPPSGYDYDVCNADVLLHQTRVENGMVVLDSGMHYRLLVLPNEDRMTLPVLQKVAALIKAGATVYGPKPLHSPSLTGYPESEDQLKKLADEAWGDVANNAHPYGQGKVVLSEPLEKALGVGPDFAHESGDLLFIHRRTENADIYFISNQEPNEITTNCTFRVTGKVPELWHADTGQSETLANFSPGKDGTTVPIHFDPTGSVFVIFQNPVPAQIVSNLTLDGHPDSTPIVQAEGKMTFTAFQSGNYEATLSDGIKKSAIVPPLPAAQQITGPWDIAFPPKLGAPESATFDHLISWADSPVDGIKYFSGTATYRTTFNLSSEALTSPNRLYLDLGDVKNLADVTLNGKHLGVLWKRPFSVEITGAAAAGENKLEVQLTNLWPNRLIGDQSLPESQRITWASVNLYKATSPLLPSGLLGPVQVTCGRKVELISK